MQECVSQANVDNLEKSRRAIDEFEVKSVQIQQFNAMLSIRKDVRNHNEEVIYHKNLPSQTWNR